MKVEERFDIGPYTTFEIDEPEEIIFDLSAYTSFFIEVNDMSNIWLPPFHCVEGDEIVFSGPWTKLDVSSVSQTIYDGEDDKTSELASGASSVSNNVATFAEISGFSGGKSYVVVFQATTSGGQKYSMKRMLIVDRAEDTQ